MKIVNEISSQGDQDWISKPSFSNKRKYLKDEKRRCFGLMLYSQEDKTEEIGKWYKEKKEVLVLSISVFGLSKYLTS